MTICTRETAGTGVTCKGSPLTNTELDNNFINIVADISGKQDSSTALTTSTSFSGDITGAYNSTALAADSVGINELDISGTGASGSFVSYNAFSGGDFCWAVPPNQYISSATVSSNCISFGYHSYGPPNLVVDFDCANFDLPRCSAANTFSQYNTFSNFLCVSGTLKSTTCNCLEGRACFKVCHPSGCFNNSFGQLALHCAQSTSCFNVAVGKSAMCRSHCATCSVGIGVCATASACKLCGVVGVGYYAARCTGQYGSHNSFFGTCAGQAFCGNFNTGLGAQNLGCCGCGSFNAAFGTYAGYRQKRSSYNVYGGPYTGCGLNCVDLNCDFGSVRFGYLNSAQIKCGSTDVSMGMCTGFYNRCSVSNISIGYGVLNSSLVLPDGVQRYNVAIGTFAMQRSGCSSCNIVIGMCSGLRVGCSGLACNNVLIGNGAGTNECIGGYLGLVNVTGTCSNMIVHGNCCNVCALIKIGWSVVSDCRDKSCFSCVPHGLDFVRALEPKEYRFRSNGRLNDDVEDKKRYGFLAQDVLALEGDDPVVVSNDDNQSLKMTESHLIPILVNAIKELANRVEALENA